MEGGSSVAREEKKKIKKLVMKRMFTAAVR